MRHEVGLEEEGQRRVKARLLLHAAVLLVVATPATTARADEPYVVDDTLAAIEQASASTGIPAPWLRRVVDCEDHSLDPYAVGDHGTSFGPAQLHRGGGELVRFYAVGYTDPFSPYEAIQFMAEEFLAGRSGAWSCR